MKREKWLRFRIEKWYIGLQIGRIEHQFVTLPKFLISVYLRPECYTKRFFQLGRQYSGYVGLYWFISSFHFNLWISNNER